MDKTMLSTTSVWLIILPEVLIWVKCRPMLATPKARNPWCIEIKCDLPQELSQPIRDAVKKGVFAFGVSL